MVVYARIMAKTLKHCLHAFRHNRREGFMFFGRPFGCPSIVRRLTPRPIAGDAIFLLAIEAFQLKLATNIHHPSSALLKRYSRLEVKG